MNIFITGANGFVGSRLMWFLEDKGHQVRGIDKSEKCQIKKHPNTKIGDIRFKEDLDKFNDWDFDLIIHCAAEKHDFGISKEKYFDNNEHGTEVLMEFATRNDISNVIYYSTVSVYGHQEKPCDENGEFKPNTVYGESKLAGEFVINKWQSKNPNRKVVFLRPTIIYGAHNFANMYNLIDMMHRKPWVMIGNGNHVKSVVSLANIIDMTYFALTNMKSGIETYNCIDKPYITVNQLMRIIAKNKGFRMPLIKIPVFIAVGIGFIFDFLAKITKKDLPINSDRMKKFNTSTFYYAEKIRDHGYVQKHSISDEIKKMCEWYLERK